MGGKINKTVEYLNKLLKSDPETIHTLILQKIRCSENLDIPVAVMNNIGWYTSPLGLLNGVMVANGMPLIAMHYKEHEGVQQITGFSENT